MKTVTDPGSCKLVRSSFVIFASHDSLTSIRSRNDRNSNKSSHDDSRLASSVTGWDYTFPNFKKNSNHRLSRICVMLPANDFLLRLQNISFIWFLSVSPGCFCQIMRLILLRFGSRSVIISRKTSLTQIFIMQLFIMSQARPMLQHQSINFINSKMFYKTRDSCDSQAPTKSQL